MTVNYLQVKENIWKVTSLMDKALKYDIGEDLACIIMQFLNVEPTISVTKNKHYFDIIPALLNNFQLTGYVGTSYYIILNHLITRTQFNPTD